MDNYDNSNIDDNSNSETTPEVNEQDINDNNPEQPNDEQLGNGYNHMASSNREAFTKGLNENYNDRIARNKANLQQSINRSNEATKTNDEGEEKDKNILDKAGDKVNVLKNKASLLTTQIDSARSKAFQALHPVEAAKIVAKKKIQTWLIGILVSSLPLLLGIFVVFIACFMVLGLFDSDGSSGSSSSIVGGIRECGFTISATSLSKEEYKTKIENYALTHPNLEIFADNAYDIYEYAVSKNINPELVPIRAVAEGANNGDGVTGTYNYWGMGCFNGKGNDACFDYSSFEEGYTDFVNNISQYASLADMMTKYANINKYWLNPGNSADGGCYYAKNIYTEENMPTRVKNACGNNAPKCTEDDTSQCTRTTEEDQEAYMNWQVKNNMATIRFSLFGLKYEEGICSNSSGLIHYLSDYNLWGKGLKRLERVLTASEINDLNNYINDEVNKAGYGTAEAVVAAGQSLIYGLEQMGYYLPYYLGGGRTCCGDTNDTFVGVNPNWGSNKFGYDNAGSRKNRVYLGLDCSAFVSWTIRTACNPNFGAVGASSMRFGTEINFADAQPGDLLVKTDGQHVKLVIKNENGKLTTAESIGSQTNKLVFTEQSSKCEGKNNKSCYDTYSLKTFYQDGCTR